MNSAFHPPEKKRRGIPGSRNTFQYTLIIMIIIMFWVFI